MTGDARAQIQTIFDLLETEKTALLSGDIEALETVTLKKQNWIARHQSEALPLQLSDIQKIKRLSDENAELSKACQKAHRSVLDRLNEIRKSHDNMGTYSSDGQFSKAETVSPKLETRS